MSWCWRWHVTTEKWLMLPDMFVWPKLRFSKTAPATYMAERKQKKFSFGKWKEKQHWAHKLKVENWVLASLTCEGLYCCRKLQYKEKSSNTEPKREGTKGRATSCHFMTLHVRQQWHAFCLSIHRQHLTNEITWRQKHLHIASIPFRQRMWPWQSNN